MTLDELRAFGVNVSEGMARCMNNEGFYLMMVGSAAQEKSFDTLRDTIAANDLAAAFEAAHSLKGVLGNLSITPLYEPMCQITELLRAREDADYPTLVENILNKRDELRSLL